MMRRRANGPICLETKGANQVWDEKKREDEKDSLIATPAAKSSRIFLSLLRQSAAGDILESGDLFRLERKGKKSGRGHAIHHGTLLLYVVWILEVGRGRREAYTISSRSSCPEACAQGHFL